MSAELSERQRRFLQLTKEIGLEYDEALHALGIRPGGWPSLRGLTKQERVNQGQRYIDYGLTETEANRVVSPIEARRKIVSERPRKPTPTTDWMPSKKVYNEPSPGRAKRGLLK